MADNKPARTSWGVRIVGGLVLVAALVVTYLILSAFLPRWWAQRIADMSGHGSFSKGIGSGLTLGILSTGIPLFLALFAVLVWHHRTGKFLAGAACILAVVAAIPNLMTLSITAGTNGAARAGQRILDVEAPGFRGATGIGAIIAVICFLLAVFAAIRRRRRARKAAAATEPPTPKQAPTTS